MQTREEFLDQRRRSLGSTDIPAIMGLSPYAEPWDIWDSKVLPPKKEEEPTTGPLARGRELEDIAARVYAEQEGIQIRRQPIKYHPDHPFLHTSIDRQIVGLDGEPEVMEVKVPGVAQYFEMKEEGLPPQYILQMQWHLEVWGYEFGRYVIFTPEYWQAFAFRIQRDRELGAHMREQGVAFWTDHVVPRIRPTRPMPAPHPLPRKPGEATMREDDEWAMAADAYREAHAEVEDLKGVLDAAEEELVRLAGEETHVVGAGVKLTRYSTTPQRRFDSKAFMAEFEARRQDGRPVADMDPADEAWFYYTNPSEKTKLKVITRWGSEEEGTD